MAHYYPADGAGNEAIPCPTVSFSTVTQMHDANGSGFIAPRSFQATHRELKTLLAAKGINPSERDIDALLSAAASGNFATIGAQANAVTVWNDAVWVSQRSGRSTGDFVVSIPRVSLPTDADHFSLLDDGESTTLSINHAANLLPDRLHANIKAQFTDHWIFLTNTDVKVGGYGRTAKFTFPSLKKVLAANVSNETGEKKNAPQGTEKKTKPKTKPKKNPKKNPKEKAAKPAATTPITANSAAAVPPASKLEHVYAEVTYGRALNSWSANGGAELQWYPTLPENASGDSFVQDAAKASVIARYEAPISYALTTKDKPEDAVAGFTVSVPAAVIAALDGTGKMLVEVREVKLPASKEVHLQILDGAYIAKDSEPPLKGADHVATPGAWLLNLNGLRPGTPILLHAFRMEVEKAVPVEDIQVQVIAATPPPPESKKKTEPK
jgi:hypothetical protein